MMAVMMMFWPGPAWLDSKAYVMYLFLTPAICGFSSPDFLSACHASRERSHYFGSTVWIYKEELKAVGYVRPA